MCTPNDLQIITKKISEAYQNVFGDRLVKILLYGSYARDDFNNESAGN